MSGEVAVNACLAEYGWRLPVDPLARQIISKAVHRWGADMVVAGLRRELAGESPSYALELVGRALGPEFECPHQLVKL